MRFVNKSLEHDTEPAIFWVCNNRQGPGQKKVGLLHCERDEVSPLRNQPVIFVPVSNNHGVALNPMGDLSAPACRNGAGMAHRQAGADQSRLIG